MSAFIGETVATEGCVIIVWCVWCVCSSEMLCT